MHILTPRHHANFDPYGSECYLGSKVQESRVKNVSREPGFQDTDHRRRRGGAQKLELIQFREEAMI